MNTEWLSQKKIIKVLFLTDLEENDLLIKSERLISQQLYVTLLNCFYGLNS